MYTNHPNTIYRCEEFRQRDLLARAERHRQLKEARRGELTLLSRWTAALADLARSLLQALHRHSVPTRHPAAAAPADPLR